MRICESFKSAKKLGMQITYLQIAKNIWSPNHKSANWHTCRRSANVYKFCKSVSSRICYLRNLFANHPPLQICHRYQPHQRYRQENLRCRWYQWCTLTCEYLRKFLKKFLMALKLFSGAWGKIIHEKTWSKKSFDTDPLKQNISAIRSYWYHFTKLYQNTENTVSWDCPFKKQTE